MPRQKNDNSENDDPKDRGECADILLYDRHAQVMIAIEAKFHSNWTIEKDIIKNAQRLKHIKKQRPEMNIIHCLLVTKVKWNNVQKQGESGVYNTLKNYNNDNNNVPITITIITWEQLLPICDNSIARTYLSHQLNRTKDAFYLYNKPW